MVAPAEPNDRRLDLPEDVHPGRRAAVPVHVRKLATVLTWLIVVAVVFYFFAAFKTLLLGVLAAAAVACALRPLRDRMPWARGTSGVVVGLGFVLMAVAVLVGIGLLLARPVQEELAKLPETRQDLDASLARLSGQWDLNPPIDSGTIVRQAGGMLGGGGVGDLAGSVGQTLVSAVVAAVLVGIGSVYFLAEPPMALVKPLLPGLPPRRRRQLVAAMDELGPKLRWWLVGVLFGMTVVGVISGIGYALVGVKFAIPLALLCAACELVPTIGPIVGGLAGVAVASTQGTGAMAGAAGVYVVVQTLESYLITPLVMKRAVKIPAVVTLFTVILWGEVFGAAGLFLAVPIDLVVWAAYKHFVAGGGTGDDNANEERVGRRRNNGNDQDERELLEVEAHPT
ncbi:MAG TPA: AI-2E family transporter [Humisphaera sp.]